VAVHRPSLGGPVRSVPITRSEVELPVADPDGRSSEIYRQIARRVAVKIAEKQQDHSAAFPKIVVQNT